MIDLGRANAELDDLLALAEHSERSMEAYAGSLCELAIEGLRDRLERAPHLKDNVEMWMHNISRLWEQDKEVRLKRWRSIENRRGTYKSDLAAFISNLKGSIPRVPKGELYAFLADVRRITSVAPGSTIPKVSYTLTSVTKDNETSPAVP